jgi:hypothetical protein
MNTHKWFPTVLTVLLAGLASPACSLAANGHGLISTFGAGASNVTDPEPLSDPTGVAVDEKTKEIYVIDSGHERVERFSATGVYEGQFSGSTSADGVFHTPNAIAVDNDPASPSYGDIYVANAGNSIIIDEEGKRYYSREIVDKFEPAGIYLNQVAGSFEDVERGLTVAPSGDLWVFNTDTTNSEGHAEKFDDSRENVFLSFVEPGASYVPGFTVDSNEDLYVVNSFTKNLGKYSGAIGEDRLGQVDGCGCVTFVAVEPATNNVYVDQGTSVQEYPPFGEPFETPVGPAFGAEGMTGSSGIAVSAKGLVYVTNPVANDVETYEEGPEPEPPVTGAGTVEGLSATLEGKLAGGETGYHFDYNTNGTCTGTGVKKTPLTAATGSGSVSVKITGLIAKTQYTYCLIADGTYGHPAGSPVTVETKASPPTIEKTSSTVNRVTAALSATVNPELEPSTCVFQYGTSENYGQETPCAPGALGEGSTPVAVTATLKGLEPNTTYDYRVLATNNTGHQAGPNETFTTEVITPTQVETAPALDITPTGARLGGQVNPQGGATYYIEYGPPTCSLNGKPNYVWWLCATKTIEAGPLTGNTLQTVTPFQVTGLTPGTTYKYWIVAHNKNGSERGEEATFTTPALPTSLPQVVGVTPLVIAPQIVPPAILPAPKITITAANVKGNALNVIVRTTVAGTVTITGAGLPKTTKTLAAGTHQVTIALKNRKKHHRHTKITLQVTLKAGTKTATATRTVKL